jgi:hypothetical protein
MWPSVVVEADTISDDAGGVLEAFKAVAVDILWLNGKVRITFARHPSNRCYRARVAQGHC